MNRSTRSAPVGAGGFALRERALREALRRHWREQRTASALLTAGVLALAGAAQAQFPNPLELSALAGDDGFVLNGRPGG